MKAGTFITKSFLPSAQGTEVLCCLWNFVCKQLEGDVAQGLAVHGDVEEHGGIDHGWAARAAPGRWHLQGPQRFMFNVNSCLSRIINSYKDLGEYL